MKTIRLVMVLLMFASAAAMVLADVSPDVLKANGINMISWTAAVELPGGMRWGKPQQPKVVAVWLPEGVEQIRGLFWPGRIIIGFKLAKDGEVRKALAKERMGVLVCPIGGGFLSGRGSGAERLDDALMALGKQTGHPELRYVPFLTAGHSADGLFCRNVGYWKPQRTIGVVMIKSGNFHHGIEDIDASLKGVPLIHFSGEFEEYGPEGGDMGAGLRSAYVTEPFEGPISRRNQTQWVMTRMQMLERRRKDEDNLWTLVVDQGGKHTTWSRRLTPLFIQYLHSVVALRLPDRPWDGKSVLHCQPVTARDGWLYDADIKDPKHEPAPYADYDGDKNLAFWAPDGTFARMLQDYYTERPWSHPDPTAGKPPEERFSPPPILRDLIDSPPPQSQEWRGGDLVWTPGMAGWTSEGAKAPFAPGKRAVFCGKGGTIAITNKMSTFGMNIGDGYVLNVGTHNLYCGYHATFAPGAEIQAELTEKSRPDGGKWNRCITIQGNANIAGRLVVTTAPGLVIGTNEKGSLKQGLYAVVGVKGRLTGDFSDVVLPPGTTGRWYGGTYCVDVPRVYTEKEKADQRKRLEEKYQNAGKVMGLEALPDEDVPESPRMSIDDLGIEL